MNRKQVNNEIPHSGQCHDTGFSFIILCYYQCIRASAHRVLQRFKCWTYFYLKTAFSERRKDFKGRLKSDCDSQFVKTTCCATAETQKLAICICNMLQCLIQELFCFFGCFDKGLPLFVIKTSGVKASNFWPENNT